MDRLAVGKLDWPRCDFKCRRNVERVAEERTIAGKLFQMVGAAVRKPRVYQMTSYIAWQTADYLRRIVRFCMGCAGGAGCMARYGGLPVLRASKVRVAILNLTRASMGSQWSSFLQNGGTRISISFILMATSICYSTEWNGMEFPSKIAKFSHPCVYNAPAEIVRLRSL